MQSRSSQSRLVEPQVFRFNQCDWPRRNPTYDGLRHIAVLGLSIPGPPNVFMHDYGHMVVFIAGVCRNEGCSWSRAGWGAYFGPGSIRNRSGCLPDSMPQTRYRAVIEALRVAMDQIDEFFHEASAFGIKHITIVTDSQELQQTMCEDIWREDVVVTEHVQHRGELLQIHQHVKDICSRQGAFCSIWHRPWNEIRGVMALAISALS